MEYSKDIKSYANTIEYYCDEIIKFVQAQIDEDDKLSINVEVGTVRWDCFVAIASACNSIKVYCKGIEVNVVSAETQDSKLKFKEVVING